jgi:hypothetical protein
LATPLGNPSLWIPPLGFPCYSSSETYYLELIMIKALDAAMGFLEMVATTPGYRNPDIVVETNVRPKMMGSKPEDYEESPDMKEPKESDLPKVSAVDPAVIEAQLHNDRMWKTYEETGEAVDPRADEDEPEMQEPK